MMKFMNEHGEEDLEEVFDLLEESFFLHECRTRVRDPKEIEELVGLVLEYYRERVYPVKGDPRRGTGDREAALVTDVTIEKWQEIKKHVGCLVDPPNMDVYVLKAGRDKKVSGGGGAIWAGRASLSLSPF